MIAEAPTGLGKTAASLASALAAAKKIDGVEKILFLTGRQSQHKIVVETLRQLNGIETNAQGGVSIVDLIGRESMCGKLSVDRQCFCEEGSQRRPRR